eukprot:TRINITY_DN37925_c0_g1_i1.p1 TRINITY_DN37925_c0_g1~~TRINITY_DN37925_c0_g1_i1.p1  ORF type:complete len:233 (-),score=53.48 TRINITY_DN37925_c0_g1_i1:359-1057(-)
MYWAINEERLTKSSDDIRLSPEKSAPPPPAPVSSASAWLKEDNERLKAEVERLQQMEQNKSSHTADDLPAITEDSNSKTSNRTGKEIQFLPGAEVELQGMDHLQGRVGIVEGIEDHGRVTVTFGKGVAINGIFARSLLPVSLSTALPNITTDDCVACQRNSDIFSKQAEEVRIRLELRAATAATQPKWGEMLWQDVARIERDHVFAKPLTAVLVGHGYVASSVRPSQPKKAC